MNQIFNLTKTVFNKKCLGKEYSLAATTKVQVDKIYGYVRMIGNLRYVFFGKSFEKPLYDFIQKAGTSMTK